MPPPIGAPADRFSTSPNLTMSEQRAGRIAAPAGYRAAAAGGRLHRPLRAALQGCQPACRRAPSRPLLSDRGAATSGRCRLGLTRGKPTLRRSPYAGGSGLGDPNALRGSFGQRGAPIARDESVPPPIGAPADRFSTSPNLTMSEQRAGRIAAPAGYRAAAAGGRLHRPRSAALQGCQPACRRAPSRPLLSDRGAATSGRCRLGLTRGKPTLRRSPYAGGSGSGDPNALRGSFGQRGAPIARDESVPPPIGASAGRFSDLAGSDGGRAARWPHRGTGRISRRRCRRTSSPSPVAQPFRAANLPVAAHHQGRCCPTAAPRHPASAASA